MARRGLWLIGGVAVGVGALVLKPDSRTWLRRRLGLEPEDQRWFAEDESEPAEHEGDEPLDTREARFSLRARLAEEGVAEPAPAVSPLAAAPPPPPPPPAAAPIFESATPAPAPPAPPAPAPAPASESVPAVAPEDEAPKAPGEDTSEIEPVPSVGSWEPPAAAPPPPPPPPPPPTPLRPAAPPPPSRPFTGEGASFRSAIDAARERVHGAAREATPDEGESTEPIDESS